MRVRQKDQKNLLKVGAFIAALTVILMVIIVSIGKETSLFESKVSIRARVPNVSNLKTGSYVELKGIRVGAVSGIRIVSEDEVEILMTILASSMKWIKVDSKISIATAGLVGDKYVEIYSGSREADPLEPEKDVLVSDAVTDFKSIISKGETITQMTERILTKLDSLLSKIEDGKLVTDTLRSINTATGNLEKVSLELREAKVGQMMKNMTKASTSLEKIVTRVEQGPGTLHSLIYQETVHDDLRALLGGAQRNKVIKYFIRESIKKSEERKPQKN